MTKLTGIIDVADAATLRTLAINPQDSDKVFMPGVGFFDWAPGGTDDDNGSTVIKPDGINESEPGRWVRLVSGGGVEWSRTVLVDGGTGSDTNSGYQQPVKTLACAHTVAGNGHSILIAEGDYSAQDMTISKQNLTVTGMTSAGSSGVKTTVGAITATGLGPKLAQLQATSLSMQHPDGNGAHTSDMLINGTTSVNSAAFWEDHGSKFVGIVTLAGAGAKYLYDSQLEGGINVLSGSGFVALTDVVGNGSAALVIPAGVVYALRNVSGFVQVIDPGAINVIDALTAAGATEAQAWALAESVFSGVKAHGMHLAGRLVADEKIITLDESGTVPAHEWERSAALAFAATFAQTVTLAQSDDTTTARIVPMRNTSSYDLNVEGYLLKAGAAAIGIRPAGETSAWVFIGGGSGGGASDPTIVGGINGTGVTAVAGDLVRHSFETPGTWLTARGMTADVMRKRPVLGLVVTGGAAGTGITVQVSRGIASISGATNVADNGRPLYLKVDGSFTDAPPASGAYVKVGVVKTNGETALAPSVIDFDPEYVTVDGLQSTQVVTDFGITSTDGLPDGRYVAAAADLDATLEGHEGKFVDIIAGEVITSDAPAGHVVLVTTGPAARGRYETTDTNTWVLRAAVSYRASDSTYEPENPAPGDWLLTTDTGSQSEAVLQQRIFDGAGWKQVGGVATFKETLTITTTSNVPPVIQNASINEITLRDDGSGVCDVIVNLRKLAGGTSGLGTLMFKLPAGYEFDTTAHPLNTQTVNVSGLFEVSKLLPGSGLLTNTPEGIAVAEVCAIPHSKTHFKVAILRAINGCATWYMMAHDYFVPQSNVTLHMEFRFKKA